MPTIFPTQKSDPELYPVRSGLVFGFFNALTWQVGIGTPMVLFAERLGATTLQVGLAYSFVFTLTPIQVLSTALLPRYGGRGMYGMHVHRAVCAAGETESGITIHYVNENYDEGDILFQATCPLTAADSPEEIARKVQALEHQFFAPTLEKLLMSE